MSGEESKLTFGQQDMNQRSFRVLYIKQFDKKEWRDLESNQDHLMYHIGFVGQFICSSPQSDVLSIELSHLFLIVSLTLFIYIVYKGGPFRWRLQDNGWH